MQRKMSYVLVRTTHDASELGKPVWSFTNEQEANQVAQAMNGYTWQNMDSSMRRDKLAEYDQDVYSIEDVHELQYVVFPVPQD